VVINEIKSLKSEDIKKASLKNFGEKVGVPLAFCSFFLLKIKNSF